MNCAGRQYFRRRLAEGDTRRRALRALKRRLSRVVFQSLRADRELRAQAWPIVGGDPAARDVNAGTESDVARPLRA